MKTTSSKRYASRLAAGLLVSSLLSSSANAAVAVQIPSHVTVGTQSFDATTAGLRAYLESIQTTRPLLYSQLAPDVERLETRRTTAVLLAAGGAGIGLATVIYGLATRKTCSEPTLDDPLFEAKTNAWANCNDGNMKRSMGYGLGGLGVLVTGLIAAAVVYPGRDDILGVVNRHNALDPQPMQLQLGFDPQSDFAYAGARMAF